MPAYRERVYLCPVESGKPGWIVEFPLWWDRSEFFKKFGDRQIDTGNPFYVDYGLLLTGWEAREWDTRSRELFSADPHSKLTPVFEAMGWWDSMLGEVSWVIVESYEWESGLSWGGGCWSNPVPVFHFHPVAWSERRGSAWMIGSPRFPS